jgi:hypothetical protein
MKRLLIALALVCVLAVASVAAASAASNPSGTGQPSVECGDPGATSAPDGFGTGGFAIAETKYAGSGQSTNQPASTNAVSQYDVACYQVTSSGH